MKLNVLLSQVAADLAEDSERKSRYRIPPTANVPARLLKGNEHG